METEAGFDEAVFFFEGEKVATTMLYSEFEALLCNATTMDSFAASVVNCAYAAIGMGLTVRGLVFFKLAIDESGKVDSTFNIPLRYLVRNAGSGPDLGQGPIRLSCRGQCSVPWHANNLWDPRLEGEGNSAELIQKVVWRNKLGFKPINKTQSQDVDLHLTPATETQRVLESRVAETFGDKGKVSLQQIIKQHNVQLNQVSRKYRTDIEDQQQTYLDQIRSYRDEIQQLKVNLRHEQDRGRRLQQLLRGEAS